MIEPINPPRTITIDIPVEAVQLPPHIASLFPLPPISIYTEGACMTSPTRLTNAQPTPPAPTATPQPAQRLSEPADAARELADTASE